MRGFSGFKIYYGVGTKSSLRTILNFFVVVISFTSYNLGLNLNLNLYVGAVSEQKYRMKDSQLYIHLVVKTSNLVISPYCYAA